MASVRKFRNNWVADYRDQWGKRHREKPEGSFENRTQQKRAAHALLKKRLDDVDRGTYSPESKNLTFSKLADAYLASKVNVRPSTRRNYSGIIEIYLKPYFGSWKARHISAADIERYRNEMANGRPSPIAEAYAKRMRKERPALSQARAMQRVNMKSPSVRTINKTLTLLVMIFNYACRHRLVDFNPGEHVEKLKREFSVDDGSIDANVLSPKEVRKLIDAAEPERRDKKGALRSNNYRLIIQFAIFTGMRSGEIRGLRWGDIDWNSNSVYVRRSWKEGRFHAPKTKASARHIELPASLASILRKWQIACPSSDDDLVFPNLCGKPISGANLLQRGFYPALRRAGLRRIRFHDLRHTFASLMIANGEDIVRVSRLLGHSTPTVTLSVYSHMLPNDHYESANRLQTMIYGDQENDHLVDSSSRTK